MATHCALCSKTGGDSDFDRFSGLDLCTPCARGNAAQAALNRGWQFRTETWVERVRGKYNDHVDYHCRTRGDCGISTRLQASFGRKYWYHSLIGLFTRPPTTGDPLFDNNTWISTGTRDQTAEFLQSEGAQSAIMDLVGEGASISIRGGVVEAHARGGDPPEEHRVEVETAVLLIHVQTFAAVASARMTTP